MEAKDFVGSWTNNGLLMIHKALRDAFDKDEETPPGHEKPYGVRIYTDFKEWSDALENEMANRGVPFDPVPW